MTASLSFATFATLESLRRSFWLLVLLLAGASALGQNGTAYSWRNLTGQPGGSGNADGIGSAARFFEPQSVAVDRAGNVYVADAGNNTIRKVTSGGVVTTLAGLAGQFGSADGTNEAALFNRPLGVAVDGVGNVYVADTGNNTIRKITSTGVVTTLAGFAGEPGDANGTNNTALFNEPSGVAVDGAGNVYAADAGNNTIRKVTGSGVVTTLAGTAGLSGSTDGTNTSALFFYPTGVAVDGAGNVYVADLDNNAIRKVTSSGVVTTLAGLPQFDHFGVPIGGYADGAGTNALFDYPTGITVDGAGNVYVADAGNSALRMVTSSGVVTTLAGTAGETGSTDGTNGTALFSYPTGVAVDGAGNIYVADFGNNTLRQVTETGVVTTLAGFAGEPGDANGTNNTALFNEPSGVAVDGAGNVYAADFGNNTLRQVTETGVVTTLAGSAGQPGNADVTGSMAQFNSPIGTAVDCAGNVYVADGGNFTIRKITINGVVTTLAGSAGQSGSADGTNNTARFGDPTGVAVDGAGNVYVADAGNDTIRKVTSGGVVTTLAGLAGQFGSADGTNNTARFNHPSGVAVDGAGNIYIVDTGNNTIREVTGAGVVTTLAGFAGESGSADGTNNTALFNGPSSVAVDGAGNVYVVDAGNDTIREITSGEVVTTLAGSAGLSGSADGTNSVARFSHPFGVTVGTGGNLYVSDAFNFTLREVTTNGVVTTFAGSAGQFGSADGTGGAARFSLPSGVAANGTGEIYVADTGNSTIRQVTTNGVATTLAGIVGQPGSADAVGSEAQYFSPGGVAVDVSGNMYVADTDNSTIRKMTSDGGVTTLAGMVGQPGSSDGTNGAAQFSYPSGVAVDASGNVYVADTDNSTIRLVTSNGVVTTLTGTPGQFGSTDGTEREALFSYPAGVAVDRAGNLYVADTGNNTIRKITTDGMVTTLAGNPQQPGSVDGTGEAAEFNLPNGVAVDSEGNVYVADAGNNTIRKITSGGVVTTLAGSPGQFGSADGTNGTALFNFPRGVAVDSVGNLYVTDSGNNTIRKVTANGVVTTIGGVAGVMGGADGIGSLANFAGPGGIAVDGSGRFYVADAGNNRISLGVPLPLMNIQWSATGGLVSWPASFSGFVLQRNSDLGNPGGWTNANYSITDDGTNNSITISPPAGNQFFRLRMK